MQWIVAFQYITGHHGPKSWEYFFLLSSRGGPIDCLFHRLKVNLFLTIESYTYTWYRRGLNGSFIDTSSKLTSELSYSMIERDEQYLYIIHNEAICRQLVQWTRVQTKRISKRGTIWRGITYETRTEFEYTVRRDFRAYQSDKRKHSHFPNIK